MDGVDYAMIVNGVAPTKQDVTDFFLGIAPGRTTKDMLKLGVEEKGKLIGIVEIAQNFPAKLTWHIGLLMLHSSRRGKRIGRTVVRKIEENARAAGASQLRVGVVEENARALAFWEALQFREIHRLRGRQFGTKKHTVIELIRPIVKNPKPLF